MKVKCEKCGFEGEGNFCSNCAAPLPTTNVKKCPNCGTEGNWKFCSKCGSPLTSTSWPLGFIDQKIREAAGDFYFNEVHLKRFNTCPVCQIGTLGYNVVKDRYGWMTISEELECKNCGATLSRDGNKFKLVKVTKKSMKVWEKYGNKSLTTDEWIEISTKGEI